MKINYENNCHGSWSKTPLRGFASYNIRNPNTIQNETKECYHRGKLPQTSLRKDGDEVSLNWNPNGYKSYVVRLESALLHS